MFPSEASQSSAPQFCISWASYKNCISNGFSRFQQNGEFVDMTLAAEGYLVKVHQNIVALASPYLKAMILSASCQHPVVFLNNISQEILSFILEYMYTGEVNIPRDAATAFIDACKALHINGVENLYLPKRPEPEPAKLDIQVQVERIPEPPPPPPPDNNFAAHITINSDNFNVEVIPNKNDTTYHLNTVEPMNISIDKDLMNYQVVTDANIVENENNLEQDFPPQSECELPSSPLSNREEHQSKTLVSSDHSTTTQDLLNIEPKLEENQSSTLPKEKVIAPKLSDRDKTQHYSISNRGSLQLMVNRFMYYCHHQSCEGRKRRWRCVDYRKLHCPAVIDTLEEDIVARWEDHSHPDHDVKILRKFKSKRVYTTLVQAQDRLPDKPAKQRSRKRVFTKMDASKL